MKHALFYTAFVFLLSTSVEAADSTTAYDGDWDTTISCENAYGALGYSFKFSSTIKNGNFYGTKGEEGKPGWLELKGEVAKDGSSTIYADGLVGASQAAVGHRPAGTEYGYHIKAHFDDEQGSGKRVEGRPCDITFEKQQ